jgi:hypothetical protein
MAVVAFRDPENSSEMVRGCAIGFVDTEAHCDAVVSVLLAAGFSRSLITVLNGSDGIGIFQDILNKVAWTSTVEEILKQSVSEMNLGHRTVIVETPDRNEAVVAVNVAVRNGGHGFRHFALMSTSNSVTQSANAHREPWT